MVARILLVEDDSSLGATLSERLKREGFAASWAQSCADARAHLKLEESTPPPFDLIIMDVGLPDGSGMDLARDIRMSSLVPLIFLTAMSSPEYRLEGFELGAADYIPKPFHLRELMLRIDRVLGARAPRAPLAEQSALPFVLEREAFSVLLPSGQRVRPATRDFQLLCLLVDEAPRVVSREEIVRALWSDEEEPHARTIDNCVVRLRQALGDTLGHCIRSVRGVGYQFMVAV